MRPASLVISACPIRPILRRRLLLPPRLLSRSRLRLLTSSSHPFYTGVLSPLTLPVSAYGIKPSSTIALVGGEPLPAHPQRATAKLSAKARAPRERTEASTVAQIRSELDAVRATLQPSVDVFLSALDPAAPVPAPTPTVAASAPAPQAAGTAAATPLEQEHVRLGELLLQALLRLDAITAEGEWEEARRERKGAVREVQALLDRLDGGWRARARI